jgi:quercetin dioxygenase-like cupin family protein
MDASGFASLHWTQALRDELEGGRRNGRVGSRLVSETEKMRVWLISLGPGERLPFHTHVNDYFWTATSPGRARSRYADGRVAETAYSEGDTRHFAFGPGESMTHDLENVGDTVLRFATVEFLGGANTPLRV